MPAYAQPPEVVVSLKEYNERNPPREPNIICNESDEDPYPRKSKQPQPTANQSSDDETYNFSRMQHSISKIHNQPSKSTTQAHYNQRSYLHQVEEED